VLRFLKAAENPELPLQKLEVEVVAGGGQAVEAEGRGQIFFSPADTFVDASKCHESFILWGKVQKGQRVLLSRWMHEYDHPSPPMIPNSHDDCLDGRGRSSHGVFVLRFLKAAEMAFLLGSGPLKREVIMRCTAGQEL
jgi:hypothetical protein